MGLAMTTLRIGLGTVMAGHGLQKLAGKFGGPGLDGAAAGFEQMGMVPGKPYATAAAVTETVGGGLLALGFHTPLAASMITGAMTVAIGKVHGKNGLWLTGGGFEYNATIIAAVFGLTEHGSTFPALDGLLVKKRKGLFWAIFELVAGVAGGIGVMKLSERTAPPASEAPAGIGPEAAADAAPAS